MNKVIVYASVGPSDNHPFDPGELKVKIDINSVYKQIDAFHEKDLEPDEVIIKLSNTSFCGLKIKWENEWYGNA